MEFSFPKTRRQIVLAALIIRMLVMIPELHIVLNPSNDHFRFGWEMGRVARSLTIGQGFSSPYGGDTGPTAVLPPAYPYLLAGVFRFLGVYTTASALAILILNSIFSALTCWPVFLLARETFGETVAMWSSWGWAFFYPAIFFSTRVVWETALTTLILSVAALLAIRLKPSGSLLSWLALGIISGLGALSNPAVVSVLPILVMLPWLRSRCEAREFLRTMSLAALGFLLTVAPWIARNYSVFHRIIPFRTNFGLELYIGNNPRATGLQVFDLHPSFNAAELEDCRRKGEIQYMEEKKREAWGFISANPGDFALLTLKRIALWWVEGWEISGGTPLTKMAAKVELLAYSLFSGISFAGLLLAIRTGKPEALLFAGILLLYPPVYYLTVVHARLRHPIEPFMLILTVNSLHRTFSKKKNTDPSLSPGPQTNRWPRYGLNINERS